jgi:Sec-independent protein secretion pathway component TatC
MNQRIKGALVIVVGTVIAAFLVLIIGAIVAGASPNPWTGLGVGVILAILLGLGLLIALILGFKKYKTEQSEYALGIVYGVLIVFGITFVFPIIASIINWFL